jgi:hypothetical protein
MLRTVFSFITLCTTVSVIQSLTYFPIQQLRISKINRPNFTSRIRSNTVRCNESLQPEGNQFTVVEGPPLETKPDYNKIIGPLGSTLDQLFLIIFRHKMAQQIGKENDSKRAYNDYGGLMELASTMNIINSKDDVQLLSQNVLKSLFPSWLPNAFGWMFAKPFPGFSARMNAWATYVFGTWLMGECEINDCKIDGDSTDGDDFSGIQQGLLVKRCRFMEESGCASVCVNSCKIPTQKFFSEDMGLPLTMTPDYETFECQFSFGLTPTLEDEIDAKSTPCLGRCPSSGVVRKRHLEDQKLKSTSSLNGLQDECSKASSFCSMMDD